MFFFRHVHGIAHAAGHFPIVIASLFIGGKLGVESLVFVVQVHQGFHFRKIVGIDLVAVVQQIFLVAAQQVFQEFFCILGHVLDSGVWFKFVGN